MKHSLSKLQAMRILLCCFIILTILFAGTGIVLIFLAPIWGGVCIFISVALCFFLAVTNKKYSAAYKAFVIEQALKDKLTDFTFTPERGISPKTIAAVDVITQGNCYNGSNHLQGSYQNTTVQLADVTLQNITEGKKIAIDTLFKGRWIVIDFPQTFSPLLFCDRRLLKLKKSEERSSLKPIELNDMNLPKDLLSFAKEKKVVKDFLTPQRINQLKQLQNTLLGPLLLYFSNHQLHIAVNSNTETIQVPVFSSIRLSSAQTNISEEIEQIFALIDVLQN